MGRIATLTYICFHFFIFFTISTTVSSTDCVYMIYVKTGSNSNAGKASKVSLTLYDSKLSGIRFGNLQTWGGLMGSNYDYFQPGSLDLFSNTGPCLVGPTCLMNLTSDGSGNGGWYCDHVEVASTGADTPCAKQLFKVSQWLRAGKSLEVIQNECPATAASGGDGSENMWKIANPYVVDDMLKTNESLKWRFMHQKFKYSKWET